MIGWEHPTAVGESAVDRRRSYSVRDSDKTRQALNPFFPILAAHCVLLSALDGQSLTLHNHRHRLPGGQGPAVDCVMADFNGDGLQDLARASSSELGVFLQDRGGRFVPIALPTQAPVGVPSPEIVSLAVGRTVTGKLLDLVVGYRHGAVQVYPNFGGRFGAVVNLPKLGSINPVLEQILAGDLDGDGRDEVVVVLNSERPVVYLARAGYPQRSPAVAPRLRRPRALLADLDLDKDLDLLLVTSDPTAPMIPTLFQNSGRGLLSINPTAFGKISVAAGGLLAVDLVPGGGLEVLFSPVGKYTRVRVMRNSSGKPGYPNYVPIANTGTFSVAAPHDFVVGDFNGDGFGDLVAIAENGTVVYGQNAGKIAPASFGRSVALMPSAPRRRLCAMDLENDGDHDLLVVGAGVEDSLFLGGRRGTAPMLLDTESRAMPVGRTSNRLLAVTDVTGEGDPDLVMWETTGTLGGVPRLLRNRLGQARFDPVSPVGFVPTLPRSRYVAVHTASVTGKGDRDLLVAGWLSTTNTTGMRVLTRTARGGLADVSTARWRLPRSIVAMAVADISGAVAGSIGAAGFSDVAALDSLGYPLLVFNQRGVFGRAQQLSGVRSPVDSKVFVADLNVDRRPDIVIVQPTGGSRVFLANPKLADRFIETKIGWSGTAALVEELSGDVVPDILIAARLTGGRSKLFFLRGNGNGTFTNRSTINLPGVKAVAGTVSALVSVAGGAPNRRSLVVGYAKGFDQLLIGNRGIFAAPRRLPTHGSLNTVGLTVADLDLDGDLDVVTRRSDSWPGLSFGQTTDFAQVGIAQSGREALMQVAMPDSLTMGGLGIGYATTRVYMPAFGVVRLTAIPHIWPLPASKSLLRTVRIPLPATLGPVRLPMQLFTIRGPVLRFRNLDMFESTTR